MSGKGDAPRPYCVAAYAHGYEAIFWGATATTADVPLSCQGDPVRLDPTTDIIPQEPT